MAQEPLCSGVSVSRSVTRVLQDIKLTNIYTGPAPGPWILPPLPGITPAPATVIINNGVPTPVNSQSPDEPEPTTEEDPESTENPSTTANPSTTTATTETTTATSSGCPVTTPSCAEPTSCGGGLDQICSAEPYKGCGCEVIADGGAADVGNVVTFVSDDASETALASSLFQAMYVEGVISGMPSPGFTFSDPVSTTATVTSSTETGTVSMTSATETVTSTTSLAPTSEVTSETVTSETVTSEKITSETTSSVIVTSETVTISTTSLPPTSEVSDGITSTTSQATTTTTTSIAAPLCVPYQNPHEGESYCQCSSGAVYATLPILSGSSNVCGYTTFTVPTSTAAPEPTTSAPYTFTDPIGNVIACPTYSTWAVNGQVTATSCLEPSSTIVTADPTPTGDPASCHFYGDFFADADCFLWICGGTRHDQRSSLALPDQDNKILWEDVETDPTLNQPWEFSENSIGIQESFSYSWDGGENCACKVDGVDVAGNLMTLIDGDDGFTYWSQTDICECFFDCHPS